MVSEVIAGKGRRGRRPLRVAARPGPRAVEFTGCGSRRRFGFIFGTSGTPSPTGRLRRHGAGGLPPPHAVPLPKQKRPRRGVFRLFFSFLSLFLGLGLGGSPEAAVHRGVFADPGSQLGAGLAGLHAPAPVALGRAGDVHARLRAEAEIVLHLRHEEPRHRGHAAADDAPVYALLLVQAEVEARVGHVVALAALVPLHQRLVVVRADVADAVRRVGVRQVVARLAGVEGELQHLHAREAGVAQQLLHARGEEAQVLRYELRVVEPVAQHADKAHARAGQPFAVFRRLLAVGDAPVALKAAEVVDADDVVELLRALDAAYPPAVAVALHARPVVDGVAPELTVLAEVVGRHAGDAGGDVLLVEQEAPGVRPDVGGVERHVDGQVAYYLYAQGVDVVPQLIPLLVERVLYPGEEPHVRVQQRPVVLKAPRLSEPHVLVRPERPGHHAEMPLERHEEGVVRQPAGVLLAEACYLRGIPVPAARAGQAQDVEAVVVDLAVVHVHGVRAPVHGLDLGLFEQPVLDEQVEVYEIGVAREGGEGGVGRVAVARGAEGQELPGLLSRRGRKSANL